MKFIEKAKDVFTRFQRASWKIKIIAGVIVAALITLILVCTTPNDPVWTYEPEAQIAMWQKLSNKQLCLNSAIGTFIEEQKLKDNVQREGKTFNEIVKAYRAEWGKENCAKFDVFFDKYKDEDFPYDKLRERLIARCYEKLDIIERGMIILNNDAPNDVECIGIALGNRYQSSDGKGPVWYDAKITYKNMYTGKVYTRTLEVAYDGKDFLNFSEKK